MELVLQAPSSNPEEAPGSPLNPISPSFEQYPFVSRVTSRVALWCPSESHWRLDVVAVVRDKTVVFFEDGGSSEDRVRCRRIMLLSGEFDG